MPTQMKSLTLVVLLLCLVGCSSSDEAPRRSGKLRAFVTILPQAYLVERVAGERAVVEVLVGPGQSPHAFEPTPRQMVRLGKAQVYFSIGIPFEPHLLEKIKDANAGLVVVDTRKGIRLRRMATHQHEHAAEEHEHSGPEGTDPHVWLSPRNAKIIAANIRDGLKRLDPAHAAEFERNLKSLHADLDRVDAKIAGILAPLKGKPFFVFHPAFGYFGDAYGIKQVPVEKEGKEPSAKQLAALIKKARNENVRIIFVQQQFSQRSAEAVAEAIRGAVVPMDPLARDYIGNLERMAATIKKALMKNEP